MSKGIIKMKQGMTYSCKEKTIILNVFKYFRKINPDKSITEIVRRTAEATGCSEKSVFQFRKEEASPEGFKEPSKTKIRKNININSRFFKYDEAVRESIKFIIYDLKYKNILPSLSTILKNVNSSEKLPNFSLMTLRRLLFDMGFTYEKEKTSNKSILVEMSNNKDNMEQNLKKPKIKEVIAPITSQHTPKPIDSQQCVPFQVSEAASHNQMYLPNQTHRQIPAHLRHYDNCMIDRGQIGFQHNILLNQRIIPNSMHPIHHHNLGIFNSHRPSNQPHNSVMQ